MNSVNALQKHGQAVWLDFLARGFMVDGGLQRLVDDGLHGVTSNPSIFEKAIGHSDEYDEAIGSMLHMQDRSPGQLYECLAVEDIKHAADILRPVFDTTHGADGFVSIEVSPHIAMDTQRTIAEAKRLWSEIDRRNLMVKVPGTSAGLPAIHALTAEGINVNITLLFSRKVYERVVEAYMSGLEERAVRGGDPSPVASVASFFVSRIDTAVDKLLDEKITKTNDPSEKARLGGLKGKTAIANAKLAYQTYKQLFAGERWKALQANGARPQRLLWASTGTKNKAYSDTLYVDELIGPDTVNTMPPATLDAFRSHGVLRDRLEENVEDAQRILGDIGRAGISLDAVTDRLVEEGVELFADAADKLLGAVAKKRVAVLGERVDAQMLTLGARVETAAGEIEEEWRAKGLVRRLWRRDKALWTNSDEDQWLGWLDSAEQSLKRVGAYQAFAEEIKGAGFRDALLLGMGGSSLGPEVLARTLGGKSGWPKLRILDSTDPAEISATRSAVDLAKTLFIVSSKSGSTTEPNLLKDYFHGCVTDAVGREAAGRHFVAVTDPGSPLDEMAKADGFRRIFYGTPGIGGRYSVLSAFGLVPAAVAGIESRRFCAPPRPWCGPAVPMYRRWQTPACGSASPWVRPDWMGATR
jgi:transaldolase/glucose-6-phosphate isomerase